MPEWTEDNSSTYRALAEIAVPRRREMMAALMSLVPFAIDASFRIVEIGSGEGLLAAALLERFPHATLLALDGSESMREATKQATARFSNRVQVRAFDVAALDWWDLMHGAGLVVSSLCVHHLNDAKKQYVFKAVAERLSAGGAFLMADLIEPVHPAARRLAADAWDGAAAEQAAGLGEPNRFTQFVDVRWNYYRFPDPADRPSALFHQLVWLKHAGFAAVDCFWMFAGHAVFGGFKRQAAASGPPPPAGS
jgi:tRNA (cmo5U34)-methyltransferase